jgi:hypothetical protein
MNVRLRDDDRVAKVRLLVDYDLRIAKSPEVAAPDDDVLALPISSS